MKLCPNGGKRCFRNEAEATVALFMAQQQREAGVERRRECRAYRCPACKRWHLTSRK